MAQPAAMPKRVTGLKVIHRKQLEPAAEYVDPRSLVPWKDNPRINDAVVPHLVESIKRFGFGNPILARLANREIIAGDTRWKAAISMGLELVPCRFLDLDEDSAHQLALADNRIGEMAEWDLPKVQRVMEGWDIEAIKRLGFSDKDLKAVKEAGVQTTVVESAKSEPPPATTPVTQRGDVWKLGNHRLVCGDATKPKIVKLACGDLKPTLMVTAPPFDEENAWTDAYKLFTGDVAYVWHAGTGGTVVELSLRSVGLQVRQQIIWAKQAFVVGRGAYQWQHEPCWYAVRKGGQARWCGDRSQSTIWDLQNMNPLSGSVDDVKTNHPQQKPVGCFERPMRNHGAAGDVVYDPFCGSGTAIIAAEKAERTCIALELDPSYCDAAVDRWQKLTGKRAKRVAV